MEPLLTESPGLPADLLTDEDGEPLLIEGGSADVTVGS